MRASKDHDDDDRQHGRPADSPRPELSANKLAANRANAARSTGPRTAEGKARSSQNAVSHGLTGQASLLRGERKEDLDELARGMAASLRPRGAAECEIVARIVSLTWRLRRVARVEEALWDCEDRAHALRTGKGVHVNDAATATRQTVWRNPLDKPTPAAEVVAEQFLSASRPPIERLALYEQRIDRALHAAYRQLRALRDMREAFPEEDETQEQSVAPTADAIEAEPEPGPDAPPDEATAERFDVAPRHILQNEPTEDTPAPPTPVSERSEDPDSGAG